MRLVGDLAFLLHNYELAYSMHHTLKNSLKKDLQGKELLLLYAQALVRRETEKGTRGKVEKGVWYTCVSFLQEMASLSGQMTNLSRRELQGYLHEANSLYSSSQHK